MSIERINEDVINKVAKFISYQTNKPSTVPIIWDPQYSENPHYFEIIDFKIIDASNITFFAIDWSYNSQEFINGVSIWVYSAWYIWYNRWKQLRLNLLDDPIILWKSYFPENILITNENDLLKIYEELLNIDPVKKFLDFLGWKVENIFAYKKDLICNNINNLLSFSQELLEWALVYEISNLSITKKWDFILRDWTLRSLNIKQEYLVKLWKYLKDRNIYLIWVTKNSSLKIWLGSTFKKIDDYLQEELKYRYSFTNDTRKLCCRFEVSDNILKISYKNDMYVRKWITGWRWFWLFNAARLDYVEKLQNYDWLIIDMNIYDANPYIEHKDKINNRDIDVMDYVFSELTRLTQEHYILWYPYPLVEAHNFISINSSFKEEIINKVKIALYKEQKMDQVDIENLFIDLHNRF